MNLKKKTRKRTRKFKIDGVEVTTTTSKIIYGDEDNQFYDDHYFRKQELRELKLLQVYLFTFINYFHISIQTICLLFSN